MNNAGYTALGAPKHLFKGRDQTISCGLGDIFFLSVPLSWCILSFIIQKKAPGKAANFVIGSVLKNQKFGIFVIIYLRKLEVGKGGTCS